MKNQALLVILFFAIFYAVANAIGAPWWAAVVFFTLGSTMGVIVERTNPSSE